MGNSAGSDYTQQDKFRCQLISWNEANRMSRKLGNIIHASGYIPDIVIAIGRGGYVPARIVCDQLLFSDLTTIKIEHWGVAATLNKEARIRFGLSTDITGMRVLVVDDITDTGDTLREAAEYIQKNGAAKIKTGVLQHKICSTFVPDFYAHRIVDWRWIIYPWAVFEDLSGFINRILGEEYITTEDVNRRLSGHFQLSPTIRYLGSILEQMASAGMIIKGQINDRVHWKSRD